MGTRDQMSGSLPDAIQPAGGSRSATPSGNFSSDVHVGLTPPGLRGFQPAGEPLHRHDDNPGKKKTSGGGGTGRVGESVTGLGPPWAAPGNIYMQDLIRFR